MTLEAHEFTLHLRVPRPLQDLATAKADGRCAKLMTGYARAHLRVLDDWGMASLADEHWRDLLGIIEDRYDRGSTFITS